MKKIILYFGLIILLAVGCSQDTSNIPQKEVNSNSTSDQSNTIPEPQTPTSTQTVEFSKLSPIYKFSGEMPGSWKVDYISNIESINIYAPAKAGATNLDKSVIFIRHFSANSFLALNTVTILNRSDANVNGHAAVRYEIQKKPGVANFPNQPLWRNGQHKLIDIRYSQTNPSEFYVFAYNPELSLEQFEAFVVNLKFHNDLSSLLW